MVDATRADDEKIRASRFLLAESLSHSQQEKIRAEKIAATVAEAEKKERLKCLETYEVQLSQLRLFLSLGQLPEDTVPNKKIIEDLWQAFCTFCHLRFGMHKAILLKNTAIVGLTLDLFIAEAAEMSLNRPKKAVCSQMPPNNRSIAFTAPFNPVKKSAALKRVYQRKGIDIDISFQEAYQDLIQQYGREKGAARRSEWCVWRKSRSLVMNNFLSQEGRLEAANWGNAYKKCRKFLATPEHIAQLVRPTKNKLSYRLLLQFLQEAAAKEDEKSIGIKHLDLENEKIVNQFCIRLLAKLPNMSVKEIVSLQNDFQKVVRNGDGSCWLRVNKVIGSALAVHITAYLNKLPTYIMPEDRKGVRLMPGVYRENKVTFWATRDSQKKPRNYRVNQALESEVISPLLEKISIISYCSRSRLGYSPDSFSQLHALLNSNKSAKAKLAKANAWLMRRIESKTLAAAVHTQASSFMKDIAEKMKAIPIVVVPQYKASANQLQVESATTPAQCAG